MARKRKVRHGLEDLLRRYATARRLELDTLRGGQRRLNDAGYIAIDIWLSGKYHIVQTDYHLLGPRYVASRKGERGVIPVQKLEIGRFLDRVFYEADAINEKGPNET